MSEKPRDEGLWDLHAGRSFELGPCLISGKVSTFPAPVDYSKPIYKQHLHLLLLLKEVRDRAHCICLPFPKGASLLEMLGERHTIAP